ATLIDQCVELWKASLDKEGNITNVYAHTSELPPEFWAELISLGYVLGRGGRASEPRRVMAKLVERTGHRLIDPKSSTNNPGPYGCGDAATEIARAVYYQMSDTLKAVWESSFADFGLTAMMLVVVCYQKLSSESPHRWKISNAIATTVIDTLQTMNKAANNHGHGEFSKEDTLRWEFTLVDFTPVPDASIEHLAVKWIRYLEELRATVFEKEKPDSPEKTRTRKVEIRRKKAVTPAIRNTKSSVIRTAPPSKPRESTVKHEAPNIMEIDDRGWNRPDGPDTGEEKGCDGLERKLAWWDTSLPLSNIRTLCVVSMSSG
ncbi:hypothetical protein C8R43DRAFT_1209050, partial [Mycena crocata]